MLTQTDDLLRETTSASEHGFVWKRKHRLAVSVTQTHTHVVVGLF